jgi:hypothetical protein
VTGSAIDKLLIHRSGDESIIENAEKTELRFERDTWVLELVAPAAQFAHQVADGQLVRLHWESDGSAWEAHARARIQGPTSCDERGNIHLRLEGAEPIAQASARSTDPHEARVQAREKPHSLRTTARLA